MCFSEGLKITLKCSVIQPTLIPYLLKVFVCICRQNQIQTLNLNVFRIHCTIYSEVFQLQNQAFVSHCIINAFLIRVHLIQMYIAQAAILHSHSACCYSTSCTSYGFWWHLYSTRVSISLFFVYIVNSLLFVFVYCVFNVLQVFLTCKASPSAGFLKSSLRGCSEPWYMMMITIMLQDDGDADGYGHHHDH